MNQRNLRPVGQLIQQHRTQRGMTIRDVEKITSIPRSTLSRIEQGDIEKPNALYLSRLAKAFDVRAADYYELAGYHDPDELPELRVYLCAKLGMSEAEAERVEEIIEALQGKWEAK